MISDEQLDELLAKAEQDVREAPSIPRRREVVDCQKFRGVWIVTKLIHRSGHAWDGKYVSQSPCGLFESKPNPVMEHAISAVRQHLTSAHHKGQECPVPLPTTNRR